MDFRPLGTTGIEVPAICLGTMTWGTQNSQDEAFAQMDLAIAEGLTFWDTAEMYSVPPTPESYGRTETMIGNWFAARGGRDRVFLATKIAGPGIPWARGEMSRLTASHVTRAVEASLVRLQTDVIDLYQLHWPDRNTPRFGQLSWKYDPDEVMTPPEETLRALDDVVRQGKVRFVGLSNETPWGAMEFLRLHKAHGLPRMQSIQNSYNLLNRTYEIGLAEISVREQCGLLAYAPQAAGWLTGKYLGGVAPPGSRGDIDKRPPRYAKPAAVEATRKYGELAKAHGVDVCQMAIAFCVRQTFVTSAIIGATSVEQLRNGIAARDFVFTDELLKGIEAIHNAHPNPAC